MKPHFEGDDIWCPEPMSLYINLDHPADPLGELENIDKVYNIRV